MSQVIMVKIRHGGRIHLDFVHGYVGEKFSVEFMEEKDLSLSMLKELIVQYGYNNNAGLFYAIPSVGLGHGGLRTLSSEKSFEEVKEHTRLHKAIEILVDHGVDEAEVIEDVNLLNWECTPSQELQPMATHAQPACSQSTVISPTKFKKVVRRKKLTPIKNRTQPGHVGEEMERRGDDPIQIPEIPMHVHDNLVMEQPPTNEVPKEPTSSTKQLSSSSSDSDDSVEDENYKIDPTEAIDDEESDEMELVDEFCRKKRKNRPDSSQGARAYSANVDVRGENETVPQSDGDLSNANQETANANDNQLNGDDGLSDDSIEALGSEVEGALSSDDEELRTVRQQNEDLLIASKGRIARNSGARLEGDNEGEPIIGGGVVMPPRVHTNNETTNPLQEASNAPPHSTNVHTQPTNVGVPPSTESTHKGKEKWPSLLTTYEGGYQSDQGDSDDEAPLEHSDDESTMHRRKRKNKVKYAYFNEDVDMKAVELTAGLRFNSKNVLKEAILNYSLQKHYDLVYMKNDKMRINVACSMCRWELNAGQDLEEDDAWQIKSISPSHTCSRTFKNRLVTEN